jgi:RNA polymerase sigma-70 factor (ECF subfamily)
VLIKLVIILLLSMSKQKQDHFMKLYEPVHHQFERFCRARAFGEMDFKDLMNDSLLIAYQKFDALKNEQSILPFLIGISIRVLGNFLQKKRPEQYFNSYEYTIRDEQTSPSEKADIYFLHKALAKLSIQNREVLILFEITGLSIKEIALLQNLSEAAVKQRLKRSRDLLRGLLTKETITVKDI